MIEGEGWFTFDHAYRIKFMKRAIAAVVVLLLILLAASSSAIHLFTRQTYTIMAERSPADLGESTGSESCLKQGEEKNSGRSETHDQRTAEEAQNTGMVSATGGSGGGGVDQCANESKITQKEESEQEKMGKENEQEKTGKESEQEKMENESEQEKTGKESEQEKMGKESEQEKMEEESEQEHMRKESEQEKTGKESKQEKMEKESEQEKTGKESEQEKMGKESEQEKMEEEGEQEKMRKESEQKKMGKESEQKMGKESELEKMEEKSELEKMGEESKQGKIGKESEQDKMGEKSKQEKMGEKEQEEVKVKRKKKDGDKVSSTKPKKVKGDDILKELEKFRYAFNKEGRLRSIDTGEPFVFEVKKGDHAHNQRRYEQLGEVITEYVYYLLESEVSLKRIHVPKEGKEKKQSQATSFFFASDGYLTSPKLMVLIHGSGVVRAGQWARRLIINDCLESGTQLPFIKKAMEEGYGVVVLNTNLNHAHVGRRLVSVKGSSTPEEHANYVWKHFISETRATKIDIVAHSYGGVVTTALVWSNFKDFKARVNKIAFTDSVHYIGGLDATKKSWIIQHAKNWVSSTDPLDEAQRTSKHDVCRVSAGTPRHEQTSWFAFESIFTYFKEEHSSGDKKEEAADRVEGATGSGDAGNIEDKKGTESGNKDVPHDDMKEKATTGARDKNAVDEDHKQGTTVPMEEDTTGSGDAGNMEDKKDTESGNEDVPHDDMKEKATTGARDKDTVDEDHKQGTTVPMEEDTTGSGDTGNMEDKNEDHNQSTTVPMEEDTTSSESDGNKDTDMKDQKKGDASVEVTSVPMEEDTTGSDSVGDTAKKDGTKDVTNDEKHDDKNSGGDGDGDSGGGGGGKSDDDNAMST